MALLPSFFFFGEVIFAPPLSSASLMNEHGPNFVSKVLNRMVSLRERVVRSSAASIELMKSLHPSRTHQCKFSVYVACVEAFAFRYWGNTRTCAYCCSERESARNLMDYLAIRREDLREIQVRLDVPNRGQH